MLCNQSRDLSEGHMPQLSGLPEGWLLTVWGQRMAGTALLWALGKE